jgi:hypothetical protein
MTQACKSVAHTVAVIQALDLDPIKLKLMDPEEGQGWSREYADRMEVAYKRYLTLLAKFPDETIAPTKDVDKFWHGHILDTLKYAEDCENMFGYFLHHFPYSGLRGVDDAANHRVAGDTFHALYEREFGEPLPQKSGWCTAATPAWCTAAKPAWCTAAQPVQESAWCTAAKPLIESGTAWCTAARPKLASMA